MQHSADDAYLAGLAAHRQHRTHEPVLELVAALGAGYELFILEVVAHHQVRALVAPRRTAHRLAGASRGDAEHRAVVEESDYFALVVLDQLPEAKFLF